MKTVGAVRHQIKQVRFRHLKRRLKADMRQCPGNCKHNGSLSAPGGALGVCLYGASDPSTWAARVCDPAHGGDELARECPLFEIRRSKDETKAAFHAELEAMSMAELAAEFPDLAALAWVLDPEDLDQDTSLEVGPDPIDEPESVAETELPELFVMETFAPPPTTSWWRRLLRALGASL